MQAGYPEQSPYVAFNNNPIYFSDPSGLEGEPPGATVAIKVDLNKKDSESLYILLEKDKVKSILYGKDNVLKSITSANGTVYTRNVDGDYYDKDCNEFQEAKLIFESKVSEKFKTKVLEISYRLAVDPNHLMAVMAFETGETFSTTIQNGAGAQAFGLIQFMNITLKDINKTFKKDMTLAKLVKLSETDQLEYVYYQYAMWQKRKGKFTTVSDFYMAVFSPAFAGKDDSHVMYTKKTVKEKRVIIKSYIW